METLSLEQVITLFSVLNNMAAHYEIRKVQDDEPQSGNLFPVRYKADKIEEDGVYLIINDELDVQQAYDSPFFLNNGGLYKTITALGEVGMDFRHAIVFKLSDKTNIELA